MSARRRPALVAAVAVLFLFGIGVVLGVYLAGGSTLIATEASPDRRERVELYGANRWQRLLDRDADLLGYAKLIDAAKGATLGTSGPFELSGHSEVVWRPDRVQVATSAVFDRGTRRWTVLR